MFENFEDQYDEVLVQTPLLSKKVLYISFVLSFVKGLIRYQGFVLTYPGYNLLINFSRYIRYHWSNECLVGNRCLKLRMHFYV